MKNDLDILYIVLMKTWYDDQTIMFCNADDGNIVRNLNPSSKDEASISMYYEKIENYVAYRINWAEHDIIIIGCK